MSTAVISPFRGRASASVRWSLSPFQGTTMVATCLVIKAKADCTTSAGKLARYFTSYYVNGESPGQWFGRGAERLGLIQQPVAFEALRNLLMGRTPDGLKDLVKVRKQKPNLGMALEQLQETGTLKRSARDRNTAQSIKLESVNPIGDVVNRAARHEPGNGAAAQSTPTMRPQSAELQAPRKRKTESPAQHVPAIDVTFSVPKSVSTVWAVGDVRTRKIIETAIDETAREMFAWLQENVPLARRGRGGMQQQNAELVVGMFDHQTGRNEQDPNLHRHCLVLNVCRGTEDGKWAKVDSRELLSWVRTLGPLFNNSLATKLTERLSVAVERPEVGGKPASWFEIKSVSKDLMQHWSSRRQEILQETEALDVIHSDVKARQNANLRTRHTKEENVNREELETRWKADARRFGVTAESLQRVFESTNVRMTPEQIEQRVLQSFDVAAEKLTQNHAYFSRQKFIQFASEELQDVPISGIDVIKRADEVLQQKQFVQLSKEGARTQFFTTPAMWELESKVLKDIQALQEAKGATVSQDRCEKLLQRHPDLTTEQSNAARLLLTKPSALKSLTGVAGAGKTRTIRVVKEGLEAAGFKVIGGALAGLAKEELAAAADMKSRTVASYNYHLDKSTRQKLAEKVQHDVRMLCRELQGKSTWEKEPAPKLDRKTVLILDEAGMLDTKSIEPLLRHAKQAKATVILLGDNRQLSPIGPGAPFRHVTAKGPTCHLSENFRQKQCPEDLKAAGNVRAGLIDEMLRSYLERGRLTVTKNRAEAVQKTIRQWAKDDGIRRPERAVILTQTRAEAAHLNRQCQQARLLDGAIKQQSVVFDKQVYHVGDRVLFHKAMKIKGIENGHRATIVNRNALKKTITVKLDREESKQKSKARVSAKITIRLKDLERGQLTLGYAATTHKMQGQSIPKAYCLLGGQMTNRELTYVQVSRAKEATHLFIDRDHAGPELADIEKSMRQSGQKQLAHDLADQHRLALRLRTDDQEQKPKPQFL